MASYFEVAARDKLNLYQEQLDTNSGSDALLSRNLKELKRKDFKQQVQSEPAEVALKRGYQIIFKPPVRLGRMASNHFGKITTEKYQSTGKETALTFSGSSTTLTPRAEWSTEGYLDDTKNSPKNVENKLINFKKGDPLYINQSPKGIMMGKMNERFKGEKKTKPLDYPK